MQAAASGRERGAGIDWLTAFALAVAALAAVPILAVGDNIFAGGTGETWAHLADTVLPEYVTNTVKLIAGVSVGVIFGGVATAWLTVMHDFPGRRIFRGREISITWLDEEAFTVDPAPAPAPAS